MTRSLLRTIKHLDYLADRNRKGARAEYFENFRIEHYDPKIDDELEAIFRAHLSTDDPSDSCEVPLRILMALILRPRGTGHGRKRPKKERWAYRQEKLAVRIASERWAELVDQGEPSKRAKDMAAKFVEPELSTSLRYSGLSVSTLKSRMRLEAGRVDLKSR